MDTHFFRWFPEPYPDECLYSIMARYSLKMEISEFCTTTKHFFGSKYLKTSLLYFCQLDHLAEGLPPLERFQSMSFFNNHTANPIMQLVTDEKGYDDWRTTTIRTASKTSKLISQVENHSSYEMFAVKYCPMCVTSDNDQFAEAYLHRVHQFDEVRYCPEHGCRVHTLNRIGSIYNYRDLLLDIEKIDKTIVLPVTTFDNKNLALSRAIYSLLMNAGSNPTKQDCLKRIQARLSSQHYWVNTDRNYPLPIGSIVREYGYDNPNASKESFLFSSENVKVPRKRMYFSYLTHAIALLFEEYDDFLSFPLTMQDDKPLMLSAKKGIDPEKRVHRKVKENDWEAQRIECVRIIVEFVKSNPGATKNVAKRHCPVEFNFLNAYFPRELQKISSTFKKQRAKRKPHIDWAERDMLTCEKLNACYPLLLSLVPPERVTMQRIERHIGFPGLHSRLGKMPKTKELLERIIETPSQFHSRIGKPRA